MSRTSPALVSVVLSVRNASPWITDQLEAITTQQLGIPFEVIVADGGSTDDTVDRSRAFERLGQGCRIVDASERRGKQYGQRLGVQVARGELLVFADGDDVAAPGWLQALVDASVEFDMVGGPLDLRSLNTAALIAARPWIEPRQSGLAEAMGSSCLYASGSNCAIWRSVFLDIDEPERDLPLEAAQRRRRRPWVSSDASRGLSRLRPRGRYGLSLERTGAVRTGPDARLRYGRCNVGQAVPCLGCTWRSSTHRTSEMGLSSATCGQSETRGG
jgi:glycosyltransferase involved in cell wall biosynthesis